MLRDDDHGRTAAYLKALEDHAAKSLPYGAAGTRSYWGDGRSTPDGYYGGGIPGAKADYGSMAGPLWANPVAAAVLSWIVKSFSQARLEVGTLTGDGDEDFEVVKGHPMIAMLRRPTSVINPPTGLYSARALWGGTVVSFLLNGGEAFWVKHRTGQQVTGVRWVPNGQMTACFPAGKSDQYISHYEFKVGSQVIHVEPSEVVHFRNGLSPTDERRPYDPMMAASRSIVTVNEADTYAAATIRNGGVPSVMFTGTPDVPLEDDDRRSLMRDFHASTAGENRGRGWAAKFPVEMHELGRTPQELSLDTMLDRPTAQICALLGVSPMVIGLTDTNRTYSNYREARSAAWEDCIGPLQDQLIADGIDTFLLPDYDPGGTHECRWDRSRVQALQEDADMKATRAVTLYMGKIISTNEARKLAGFDEVPWGDDLEPASVPDALVPFAGQDNPPAEVDDEPADDDDEVIDPLANLNGRMRGNA